MGWRRSGGAFYRCKSLQGIILPPTVKAIEERTFFECSGLMTVTLHDGLEEIGAFYRCELLRGIVVPPSAKGIKVRAFSMLRVDATINLMD